jgi:hypothetical protein
MMKLLFGVLAVAGWLAGAQLALAEDAPVSGVFKGNGKEAKLAYITAIKGEPFNDKPTIVLVMTEKDHSKDPKPRFGAMFGRFGSALIITIMQDGKIIGCEVAHAAHQKSGFSAIGPVKMKDFKMEGGNVSGKLATDGEEKTFGETWEVNVKFKAKAP